MKRYRSLTLELETWGTSKSETKILKVSAEAQLEVEATGRNLFRVHVFGPKEDVTYAAVRKVTLGKVREAD